MSRGTVSAHMASMTETTTQFLTLGEITDALAALPPAMRVFVIMDGQLLSPDGVDSYRGSYDHLAIEPVNTSYERTVSDLLGCLIAADRSRQARATTSPTPSTAPPSVPAVQPRLLNAGVTLPFSPLARPGS